MTDIVDELRARALQGRFNLEAADEIERLRAELSEQCRLLGTSGEREAKHLAQIAALEKERDALRAKIEAMEKQKPAAWLHETRRDSDVVTDAVKHVWGKAAVGSMAAYSIPLVALPVAHPAPSLHEGWKPIPEKHPTFDLVDLRLADGSVLCECVPQSDGDYWWNGPSGEVFIDPRYAPATHWRLAAAPEAKPCP
jgi:hypothetical protein